MKKILLFALSAIVFAGCGKFLEEKSQSEVIPRTTADFSELLLGAGYPAPDGNPTFSETYLLDDDVSMFFAYGAGTANPESRIGTQEAVENSFYYTWQPQMMDNNGYGSRINATAGNTTYGSFYERIKGCNAVLDLIDGSIGTQEEKDRVKGEALALRAFYYFWLTNLYGRPYNSAGGRESPAVPVKLTADLSDDRLARATVGEIYDRIVVPDLNEAARLLEPMSATVRRNYRVNLPTVHVLLSRVYLYMGRYEECAAEVEKAMERGLALMDYTDPVGMIVYGSSNVIRYENPEVLWMYGSGAARAISSYMPGQGSELVAMLQADPADTRYTLFGFTPASDQGVYMSKPAGTPGAADMAVRASEAWLNIAEACALLGGSREAEALRYYNELRGKRIRNHVAENLAGDALLDAIRLERRKELCYEGHRWFDLRRQGMPAIEHRYKAVKGGPVMVFTLEEGDEMYTLPLPTSVIENNSSTEGGMVQNPSRYMPQRSASYE